MSAPVKMYSTGMCPFCVMAERLLVSKGVTGIEKIRVDLKRYINKQTSKRPLILPVILEV